MDIFKKIITICLLSAVLPCVSLSQEAQDVNRDSYVNSGDVTALYSYLIAGDDTFLATSDVNGDGQVTSVDITVIYNILLGE